MGFGLEYLMMYGPYTLIFVMKELMLLPNKWRRLMITRRHLIISIWYRLTKTIRQALMFIGVDFYLHTEARRILDAVILSYFSHRIDLSKVLFIGCDWYTRGYRRRFFSRKDYWTLDIDPHKKRYGSKQHIIDSVASVQDHFQEGQLDLIICNGVFGWGLNDRSEVDMAFHGCHMCLRDGGVFILGWNDIPQGRPLFPVRI